MGIDGQVIDPDSNRIDVDAVHNSFERSHLQHDE